MILLIWFSLIICGILWRKSKILTVIINVFLVVAAGFCTQGYDYQIYVNEYNWSQVQSVNDIHYLGYYYLERLGNYANLSYPQFRIIVILIAVTLYYFGIKKMTNNINFVYSLFLIYPFAHEATQTRSFLADAFIILSLPFLLRKKENRKDKIRDYIVFFSLSLIGMSMHFMVAIYVAFAVLFIVMRKENNIIKVLSGVILTYLLIVSNILPRIVEPMNSRIAYWLSAKSGMGVIFPIGFTLSIWGLSKYSMQILKTLGVEKIELYAIEKYMDYIFFLIPLFAYDITFNRLWRLFLLLMYTCIAKLIFLKDISVNTRRLMVSLTCLLSIAIFIYENEWEILINILQNNAVIGLW